jgi:pimeloyl-ACP methyl ester carboxylesterase
MRKDLAPVLAFSIALMILFAGPQTWGADTSALSRQGAAQSVRVGDIEVGYRVMGEGYPLLLIAGYSATMDMWDPFVISELSSRYRVILFDNRGVGKSTASDKPFGIGLFAADTVGLMDALKIKKAHILGWSMGTFIAMELALKYPERVGKLILYAGACGVEGSDVVKARPEVTDALMDLSGTPEERGKRLVSVLFPKKWLEDHPGFVKELPRPKEPVSPAVIEGQEEAIKAWEGTCSRLDRVRQPTLIVTGTEDVIIPPANSLLLASRITGSSLVRLPGGHSNMYQYPGSFSRYLLAFLEAETE